MERRLVQLLVVIAAAVPVVMDGVYLGIIRSQPQQPDTVVVPVVVAALLVMSAVLLLSLLPRIDPVLRVTLRAAAAAALLVFGFLTGFSIGVPVLLAGVIAVTATALSVERARRRVSVFSAATAALIAAATVLVGIDAVQRIVVCPAIGTYEVQGQGIVLGSYHYRCAEGRLQWLPG